MISEDKNINNIYMTQQELAARWRVSESTVFNWRDRGILPFFQVPGSTRILYPIDEIQKFEAENIYRKEVQAKIKRNDGKREKHVISAGSIKNWRI